MSRAIRNTKQIGDTTVAHVLARLLEAPCTVCLPFGDNARYDLLCDAGGTLLRIQCKTGRLRSGAIVFSVSSSAYHRGSGRRAYHGEIDAFAVFCADSRRVLLVPLTDVAGCSKEARLRIAPCRNRQSRGVRLASPYEDLASVLEALRKRAIPATAPPEKDRDIRNCV